MSLKIRLARAGTKKRPVYHIVIADSRSPSVLKLPFTSSSWPPERRKFRLVPPTLRNPPALEGSPPER